MEAITDPTKIDWPPAPDASTLHHPRLLCLHGGGTNARIFHMQCRVLALRLKPHFRLVFAEAPFPSTAGPDVLSVYADCGPFKRWVWTVEPNAVERRPAESWAAIDACLGNAMRRDDEVGATGDWVGVLGFSQGAKTAGSLLVRQRERGETMDRIRGGPGKGKGKIDFKVGVLMAGRGPLVPLVFDGDDDSASNNNKDNNNNNRKDARQIIREIPTIHVHGLQDPGIDFHQVLLEEWCEPGTTTLIEWEGNHRLPIKTGDVLPVVDALVSTARRQGVVLPGLAR